MGIGCDLINTTRFIPILNSKFRERFFRKMLHEKERNHIILNEDRIIQYVAGNLN